MPTIQEFLEPKAKGFIEFIQSHNPDDAIREQLKEYAPEKIIPTITLYILPAHSVGGIPTLANEIVNHLAPTSARDDVVKRIERYLNCFAEAISSS